MKFINNGADKKVRSGEVGNYVWTMVGTGDSIDLSSEVGNAYGFTSEEDEEETLVHETDEETEKPVATEGEAGTKTVETKQIETGTEETNPEDSETEESKD